MIILKSLCSDYRTLYKELFKKSRKTTDVRNYRTLCIEIFKSQNSINPSFAKEIFRLRITNHPTKEKYKLSL